MNNTAALGFTSFRMNLKRGSFLGTLLLISGPQRNRGGISGDLGKTSFKIHGILYGASFCGCVCKGIQQRIL